MLFRFLMGVGIGGEYPMASTVTSEGSKPEDRGRNLAAVFSMQVGGGMVWGLGTTRREANRLMVVEGDCQAHFELVCMGARRDETRATLLAGDLTH